MDNNIIYIIGGIAWVAYSLYSARQKAIKKQQNTGLPAGGPSHSSPLPIPGSQQEQKSMFEDIFRELLGDQQSNTLPRQQQDSIPEKPNQSLGIPSVKQFNYESSKMAPTSNDSTYFSGLDIENEYNQSQIHTGTNKKEKLRKNFNLRNAIIYSALLEKKYF